MAYIKAVAKSSWKRSTSDSKVFDNGSEAGLSRAEGFADRMRGLLYAGAVAASRDLFLAHPVPQQQILAEPRPAAYTAVAGPYIEYQAPTQDAAGTDFLGATCAVAMFAVIGYSVGSTVLLARGRAGGISKL